jgi:peroxiredoxin
MTYFIKPGYALVGIAALLMTAGVAYLWLAPAGPTRAPDITVTTLQGEKVRLSELRGSPVLVNFWATTCSGCIREIPHLIELYREFAEQGLKIIAIAMPYDPPNRVLAVSKSKQIPYPIALDIRGDAARAFGEVRLTPTSFLIAPDGRIIDRTVGELDIQKARTLIIDTLAPGRG